MIVVMQHGASESQIESVIDRLNAHGFDVHRSSGVNQTVLGAIGVKPDFDVRHIKVLDGVADVYRITEPYKFASRAWKSENTLIDINGTVVGGEEVTIVAGPCSVESEEQMESSAAVIAAQGGTFLRGGAFKPRSSPYAFQGLGEEGLKILQDVGRRHGLNVVTEIMELGQMGLIYPYTDVFQVGARNMQNFSLLRELGKTDKPILLKRGLSATIEDTVNTSSKLLIKRI